MQPDYNQLWHNIDSSQAPDSQFYTFFEDSLNRFIGNNSGYSKITAVTGVKQEEQQSIENNKEV